MTRYFITTKPFTPSGRNTDKVYKVVEAAGAAGATWVEIAAQAGVVSTGIYSYLYTLRKEGLVESKEVAATAVEKDAEAVEQMMLPRLHKWKCPSCGCWVVEEMGFRCGQCRSEKGRLALQEVKL